MSRALALGAMTVGLTAGAAALAGSASADDGEFDLAGATLAPFDASAELPELDLDEAFATVDESDLELDSSVVEQSDLELDELVPAELDDLAVPPTIDEVVTEVTGGSAEEEVDLSGATLTPFDASAEPAPELDPDEVLSVAEPGELDLDLPPVELDEGDVAVPPTIDEVVTEVTSGSADEQPEVDAVAGTTAAAEPVPATEALIPQLADPPVAALADALDALAGSTPGAQPPPVEVDLGPDPFGDPDPAPIEPGPFQLTPQPDPAGGHDEPTVTAEALTAPGEVLLAAALPPDGTVVSDAPPVTAGALDYQESVTGDVLAEADEVLLAQAVPTLVRPAVKPTGGGFGGSTLNGSPVRPGSTPSAPPLDSSGFVAPWDRPGNLEGVPYEGQNDITGTLHQIDTRGGGILVPRGVATEINAVDPLNYLKRDPARILLDPRNDGGADARRILNDAVTDPDKLGREIREAGGPERWANQGGAARRDLVRENLPVFTRIQDAAGVQTAPVIDPPAAGSAGSAGTARPSGAGTPAVSGSSDRSTSTPDTPPVPVSPVVPEPIAVPEPVYGDVDRYLDRSAALTINGKQGLADLDGEDSTKDSFAGNRANSQAGIASFDLTVPVQTTRNGISSTGTVSFVGLTRGEVDALLANPDVRATGVDPADVLARNGLSEKGMRQREEAARRAFAAATAPPPVVPVVRPTAEPTAAPVEVGRDTEPEPEIEPGLLYPELPGLGDLPDEIVELPGTTETVPPGTVVAPNPDLTAPVDIPAGTTASTPTPGESDTTPAPDGGEQPGGGSDEAAGGTEVDPEGATTSDAEQEGRNPEAGSNGWADTLVPGADGWTDGWRPAPFGNGPTSSLGSPFRVSDYQISPGSTRIEPGAGLVEVPLQPGDQAPDLLPDVVVPIEPGRTPPTLSTDPPSEPPAPGGDEGDGSEAGNEDAVEGAGSTPGEPSAEDRTDTDWLYELAAEDLREADPQGYLEELYSGVPVKPSSLDEIDPDLYPEVEFDDEDVLGDLDRFDEFMSAVDDAWSTTSPGADPEATGSDAETSDAEPPAGNEDTRLFDLFFNEQYFDEDALAEWQERTRSGSGTPPEPPTADEPELDLDQIADLRYLFDLPSEGEGDQPPGPDDDESNPPAGSSPVRPTDPSGGGDGESGGSVPTEGTTPTADQTTPNQTTPDQLTPEEEGRLGWSDTNPTGIDLPAPPQTPVEDTDAAPGMVWLIDDGGGEVVWTPPPGSAGWFAVDGAPGVTVEDLYAEDAFTFFDQIRRRLTDGPSSSLRAPSAAPVPTPSSGSIPGGAADGVTYRLAPSLRIDPWAVQLPAGSPTTAPVGEPVLLPDPAVPTEPGRTPTTLSTDPPDGSDDSGETDQSGADSGGADSPPELTEEELAESQPVRRLDGGLGEDYQPPPDLETVSPGWDDGYLPQRERRREEGHSWYGWEDESPPATADPRTPWFAWPGSGSEPPGRLLEFVDPSMPYIGPGGGGATSSLSSPFRVPVVDPSAAGATLRVDPSTILPLLAPGTPPADPDPDPDEPVDPR